MATPILPSKFLSSKFLYLSLLVLCFGSFKKGYAYRGMKALEEGHHFLHRHVAQVSSLLPSSLCRLSAKNKGFMTGPSLRVVHKHGPCSQLGQEAARTPNLAQMLTQDQYRVDWIQSRIIDNPTQPQVSHSMASLPAKSGRPLGDANFIVTVGLGTSPKNLTLAFDTASDLTWTQCRPCSACFKQSDPLFDPSQSGSYSNISCGSTECSQLATATSVPPGCNSGTCRYAIQYADRSYTIGSYAKEKLTLTPTESFDNFKFGCGQNNTGLFGEIAGILGLGKGPVSIVAQTRSKYGQVFSYCLPSGVGSTGSLNFGMRENYSSIAFTPLASKNAKRDPSFYYLELESISVGGQVLPIPRKVFSAKGTIIDSGTVVTRLPPHAYAALRSAFRRQMANYTLTRPFGLLDTCYDLSRYDTVSIPTISIHFKGNATIIVDLLGTLFGPSTSQLCLAFAGNRNKQGMGILGNLQQVTYDVVYDVARGRVGFGPGGCD